MAEDGRPVVSSPLRKPMSWWQIGLGNTIIGSAWLLGLAVAGYVLYRLARVGIRLAHHPDSVALGIGYVVMGLVFLGAVIFGLGLLGTAGEKFSAWFATQRARLGKNGSKVG
jgi:hypothetical protein